MSPRSATSLRLRCGPSVAHLRIADRRDGDFHLEGDPVALAHRQQSLMPGHWTHLDEVHGTRVVRVVTPGDRDGEVADAAVTAALGAVLSVWVGDCAPVVLLGANDDGGVLGALHAGWRGALDGVVAGTVGALADLGARDVVAVLGPCIHGCCNEFGVDLLDEFTSRFGHGVRATTSWGAPSLHLPAVIDAACRELGVALTDVGECTRCHPDRWFSHRRGDVGRHVVAACLMAAG